MSVVDTLKSAIGMFYLFNELMEEYNNIIVVIRKLCKVPTKAPLVVIVHFIGLSVRKHAEFCD